MAVAAVTIDSTKNGAKHSQSTLIQMGHAPHHVTIETEDQRYRIVVTEDGGLRISSESFTNMQLAVFPKMGNVLDVKAVQR